LGSTATAPPGWEIHGKENALTLKEALERFIADAGE
jgi:hypothetical protein